MNNRIPGRTKFHHCWGSDQEVWTMSKTTETVPHKAKKSTETTINRCKKVFPRKCSLIYYNPFIIIGDLEKVLYLNCYLYYILLTSIYSKENLVWVGYFSRLTEKTNWENT